MYGIILEALCLLKKETICPFSQNSSCSTKKIIRIIKGSKPSPSFVLDMANYYHLLFDDLERLNAFDDNNNLSGLEKLKRIEIIKEILSSYYDDGLKIQASIESKTK